MDYENFLKSLTIANLKIIVNKHNEKLNIKLTNSKKETLIKFLLDHTELKDNKINLKPGLAVKGIDFELNQIRRKKEEQTEKKFIENRRGDKKELKIAREIGKLRGQIENAKDEIARLEYVDYDNVKKESGLSLDKRKNIDKKNIEKIENKLRDLKNKKNMAVIKLKTTMKENEDRKKRNKT